MNSFIFTKKGLKEYNKLDISNQKRIVNKLEFLKKHKDLIQSLKKIEGFNPATHRIRIGNLRVILQKVSSNQFYVLDVGNRGNIYK